MKLVIENIKFKYDKEEILKGISINSEGNEFLTVIGPNGSGKTTFIKCINKILKSNSGLIKVLGRDISKLSQDEIAKMIAYVPQMTNDFFQGNVIDLLVMARVSNISWSVQDEDINKSLDALEKMGILELADRNFSDLSGGQKQKVLIAKALVQDSPIYLLDEPTSFLDIKSQIETMKIAKALAKNNKLVIMVVHDLNMAMRYSDKIVLMKSGKVIDFDIPSKVLTEKNINHVYEIEVNIREDYIIPL
ncbi:MAG: ABC transporter ATP-binding protein [Sarcina sp.]